jgi:hypothetical protein
MAAAKYNIAIEQGATWTLSLVYRLPNVDINTPGAAIDVSGCVAAMQIRPTVGGTTLVSLTETAGITVGDANGRIDVLITEAQTILLTVKKAVYDLYITFLDGTTVRLLEGAVAIDLTVTQPTTA